MTSSSRKDERGIPIRRLIVGIAVIVMVAFSSSGGLQSERQMVDEIVLEEDKVAVFVNTSSGLGAMQLLPYLTVYALGLAAILYYVFVQRRDKARAMLLWIFASSAFAIPTLVDVLRSYNVSITQALVPLALFLPLILRSDDFDWFISLVRRVCLIYVAATVFYTVFWFENATLDCGGCPLGPVRLHGFSEHANSLSVIPIIYFAADLSSQRKWTVLRIFQWFAVLGLLLFSQSKTPMVAALISAGMVWIYLARGQLKAIAVSIIGLIWVTATTIWTIIIPAMGGGRMYDSANDLTGRPRIWAYAIDLVKENYIGYGTGFLQNTDPTGAGLFNATGLIFNSAHNQFLGTLGQGGVLGLICLIIYLAMLGWTIVRSKMPERSGSLFLFIVLVVWGVTEQILMATIVTERFFMHLTLLTLVILINKNTIEERMSENSKTVV